MTPQIREAMRRYLLIMKQIDDCKQDLALIAEEACAIPGVEKRPFKALTRALHEAPGSIEERIDAMQEFIEMAFQTPDDKLQF